MSPIERAIPPAGEEIHIPGPSLQPLLLTVGITLSLLGITITWILTAVGLVLTVTVLASWIRDAVGEYEHLPLDHHPNVADTVTNAQDRAAMEAPGRGEG